MTTSASDRAKAIVEECRAYDSEGDLRFIACDRAASIIAAAITQAEREARRDALTRVRDAIDRSDSANDYPAWKSEALIVDMINALILVEKD